MTTDRGPLSLTAIAHRHEREVAVSTLNLLNQLDALKDRQSAKAHLLDGYLKTYLNDELELIATCAIELDFDSSAPAVRAVVSRCSIDDVVIAVASIMKRKFAKLCRDHQREG